VGDNGLSELALGVEQLHCIAERFLPFASAGFEGVFVEGGEEGLGEGGEEEVEERDESLNGGVGGVAGESVSDALYLGEGVLFLRFPEIHDSPLNI
jgi:hypothetical protein